MIKTKQMMTEMKAKAAADERTRILWMINKMIFSGNYPAAGLDSLRDLHKKILDTSE